MDAASRKSIKDSPRRHAEVAARPVLARLPDVSTEVQLARADAGEHKPSRMVGYRFDPPQSATRREPVRLSAVTGFPTLKSELAYAPQSSRPLRPHVFDRGRGKRPSTARRESPVLPRSTPFDSPQRGILDSLTPWLRFATLVGLFTAAGIWLQMVAFRPHPPAQPIQLPATTAQESILPATKTAERPDGSSTSAGPVQSKPPSMTVVGRERPLTFATFRGDILPAPETADIHSPLLSSADGSLPRVRTDELPAQPTNAPAPPDENLPTAEIARATSSSLSGTPSTK